MGYRRGTTCASSFAKYGRAGCAGRRLAPDKRRALAHLDVSGDITPDSRRVAGEAMAGIGEVLGRSYRDGPLRGASPAFAVALMSALADTTIDFMVREPDRAEAHASTAFDALWRMIT